jgi:hypothetical protein
MTITPTDENGYFQSRAEAKIKRKGAKDAKFRKEDGYFQSRREERRGKLLKFLFLCASVPLWLILIFSEPY